MDVALDKMPPCPTKIMMNVGNPELAFAFRRLPNEGVGLARLEFIISKNVGIHPKALIEYATLPADLKAEIDLVDAFTGLSVSVPLDVAVPCDRCNATGAEPDTARAAAPAE